MMTLQKLLNTTALLLCLSATAVAHDGKRTEIVVVDNKIYGQGYLFDNEGDPQDDFGGIIRPYYNAIHSHLERIGNRDLWDNITGFDLRNSTPFEGNDVVLTLLGAGKWTPPAANAMPRFQDFGQPVLEPLAADELIEVFLGDQPEVTTETLGSLTLVDSVSGPVVDIDLEPVIGFNPAGTLHFLEWQLSSPGSGLLPSDSLYTILSPPGANGIERLHFQSLALERNFGVNLTAVPEPSSLSLLAIGSLATLVRRKRS